MHSREQIIEAIKRVSKASGGSSPGWRKFATETGIRYADWHGRYWTRWSDALAEAGLAANTLNPRIDDADVLRRYAEIARDLGRLPTYSDLRLMGRSDATIPNDKVFQRFGSKSRLLSKVREWCESRTGFEAVVALLSNGAIAEPLQAEVIEPITKTALGYVYLIKSGRYYKVGRSNAVGRREREIALQLPEESRRIHTIETDDAPGIEAYWHGRFAAKRKNGEWFALTQDDVRAFKRRRFQ